MVGYPSSMFAVELIVRDYECDIQGIVNNAVYLQYLQHARHEFGRRIGCDWLALHERGIDLVISRAELDFRRPLRPGDSVRITASPRRKGRFKFFFDQRILVLPDEEVSVDAVMTVACLVDGRPAAPPEMDEWFGPAT